jgi:hypothetical protein
MNSVARAMGTPDLYPFISASSMAWCRTLPGEAKGRRGER